MSIEERILYFILLCILKMLALLPLRGLYVISDLMSLIFQYVLHYRRDIVRNNLESVFPDKGIDQLRHIERLYYKHLCDIMVETVKMLHISDSEMKKRIHFSGIESVKGYMDSGFPVMAMIAHLGNWEWLQEIVNVFGPEYTFGELYRPVRNRVSDEVMKNLRSRWSTLLMPQKEAYRRILSLKKNGCKFLIGFIADQRPTGVVIDHWMKFLGQKTAYVTGAETIGRKIGAKFVYFDISCPRRGYYEVELIPIDISGITEEEFPYSVKYMKMVEQSILRNPGLWLWSHKRWVIPQYCKTKNDNKR